MKVNLKTLHNVEARELRIRKEVSQLRSIRRMKHQLRRQRQAVIAGGAQ